MCCDNSDYKLKISISDDYYKAYMSLDLLNDNCILDLERLISEIKEQNVVYGINEKVLERVCKEKESVFDELIAEGVHHENGKNAQIEFNFSMQRKGLPRLLDNGRVDFKEMDFVKVVKENDIIAIKTPFTSGAEGITVTGKKIQGKDGKEMNFEIGENCRLSEDKLRVISEIDGIPELNGTTISVSNLLEIKGDLGVETGNIRFDGHVMVNGDVIDGYLVECTGNITVNGIVEDSVLKAGGDILITRGVMGKEKVEIICDGDLKTKFIDNANITVKGNIETGEILNSSVYCGGKIIASGKKGLILGGEVIAKYSIDAKRIGSRLGVITLICLGLDDKIITELKELSKEINELTTRINKLKRCITSLTYRIKIKPEEEGYQLMLQQSLDYIQIDEKKLERKKARVIELNELINAIQMGSVKTEKLYPDTLITIGESSHFIDRYISNALIKKMDNEVIATEY